jgi:hypothetical protein
LPLRPDPALAWQEIDGEGVVMDLARGRVLGLNPVGAFIWSHLSEFDAEAVARALAGRFEVDLETARGDVRAFLDELLAEGLITEA